MSENKSPRRSFVRRILRPWYVKLLLLIAVAFGVWYAVAPNQVINVVSIDRMHQWVAGAAPPRRKIVWQPAERVTEPTAGMEAEDSLIRPQLAENGTLLYFTRRKADGSADIYVSKLVQDGWQPANPVEALNTEADDIGPVIRQDGRRLYLYSNREGGHGGFDLYVSDRTEDGWSEPRNLGPRINSLAHEYDPSVSADGTLLFFASNRTPQMLRRLAESKTRELDEQWTTTLRADLGLNKFDLYMSQRASADEAWAAAKPLEKLNRPQANEGAPYIGPKGVFLYFVSDRNVRLGEDANFDIYRAWIHDDTVSDIDNLGSGVNTPANEIEPALSSEFRLLFSRNIPTEAAPGEEAEQALPSLRYALFSSESTEIIEERGWGQSNLGKLLAFIARNWWWLLTVLLTLLLLLALLWYAREVSLRRLPLPGFLLTALLIHVLMGLSSFYVYFGDDIVRQIKKEFEEIVIATNMSEQSLHQSHEQGQEAYEKVADLQALDTVEPADVVRQVTEMPNVPVPSESSVPQVPVKFYREMPPERLIAAPPEVEPETVESPELTRRRLAMANIEEQPLEIEQTEAVEQVRRERIEQMQVEIQRRQPLLQPSAAAPRRLPRRMVDPAMMVEREEVGVERAVDVPQSAGAQQQPTIQRVVRTVVETDVMPRVQTETLAAVVSGPRAEQQPTVMRVDVGRVVPTTEVAALPTLRRRTAVEARISFTEEEIGVERIGEEPMETNTVTRPTTLKRAAREVVDPLAVLEVEPEALAAVPSGPNTGGPSSEGLPAPVSVAVDRRQPTTTAMVGVPNLRRRSAASASSLQVEREDVEVERASGQPPRTIATVAMASPLQARRAPAAPSDSPQQIETLDTVAPAPAGGSRSIKGVDVGLKRPDTQWTNVNVKTAGQLAGLHNPRNPSLIVGSLEKESIDAPPAFSPHASRIVRRPARAPMLMYAEDNIGLQAMFRLRQGDAKTDVITAFGGSDETLAAVHRGLKWLDEHQHDDGFWSLQKFHNERQKISGKGNVENEVGATGFGLLPFLGDGNTHVSGDYQSTVRDGIEWLIAHQTDKGELRPKNVGNNTLMYSHAIATIALCEAYGMSKDARLREPAQKAIDFIVWAQHEQSGGWRYNPRQAADTSVVGWQMMALKSGQMAALNVPGRSLTLLDKWLRSVEGRGNQIGRFSYQRGKGPTPAMSAEGLLCLQYLGAEQNDPRLLSGARYLLENLPKENKDNSYYWYYGTQVMFHLQGPMWQQWNDALRDMLVDSQQKSGHLAGTWDPKDEWETKGGRIYATSLKLLMLEVYYRHLPLYQMRAEQ